MSQHGCPWSVTVQWRHLSGTPSEWGLFWGHSCWGWKWLQCTIQTGYSQRTSSAYLQDALLPLGWGLWVWSMRKKITRCILVSIIMFLTQQCHSVWTYDVLSTPLLKCFLYLLFCCPIHRTRSHSWCSCRLRPVCCVHGGHGMERHPWPILTHVVHHLEANLCSCHCCGTAYLCISWYPTAA